MWTLGVSTEKNREKRLQLALKLSLQIATRSHGVPQRRQAHPVSPTLVPERSRHLPRQVVIFLGWPRKAYVWELLYYIRNSSSQDSWRFLTGSEKITSYLILIPIRAQRWDVPYILVYSWTVHNTKDPIPWNPSSMNTKWLQTGRFLIVAKSAVLLHQTLSLHSPQCNTSLILL